MLRGNNSRVVIPPSFFKMIGINGIDRRHVNFKKTIIQMKQVSQLINEECPEWNIQAGRNSSLWNIPIHFFFLIVIL